MIGGSAKFTSAWPEVLLAVLGECFGVSDRCRLGANVAVRR